VVKKAFCPRIHSTEASMTKGNFQAKVLVEINLSRVCSKRHKFISSVAKGIMMPQRLHEPITTSSRLFLHVIKLRG
jgi:hypothetical protein